MATVYGTDLPSINMLIDNETLTYDIPHYEMILCKPDLTEIAVVSEVEEFTFNTRFGGIDEITFRVPFYLADDHNKIKNPIWDDLKGDYLIKLNGNQYFVITTPKREEKETSSKFVHCYSREWELSHKLVRGYDNVSPLYQLIIPPGTPIEDYPILNYLETLTTWSFDYIDPDLMTLYRELKFDNRTWLDTAVEIQSTFGCVFLYDTVLKTIDVHAVENLQANHGLYISDQNYIKTFTDEIDHKQIVTRLYAHGKDDVDISDHTVSGMSYIEDISLYRTLEYMSQDLLDALDAYDALLITKEGEYAAKKALIDAALIVIYGDPEVPGDTGLNGTLDTKLQELAIIERNIDLRIADKLDFFDLNTDKSGKQSEIAAVEAQIQAKEDEIAGYQAEIVTLRDAISWESNFTGAQIEQLDYFIREKEWRDNNYYDSEELYNDAVKELAKLSTPPIKFTVDMIDILQVLECQHDWDKLVLGEIVTLHSEQFGIDFQVRLVAYTHKLDSSSLSLTFSSKDALDDPNVYLADILKNSIRTAATVNTGKLKWDMVEDNTTEITQILNSEWDAAKNRVLAGSDQEVTVSERGISLLDSRDPGKLQQLRMVNNVIAMTDDGWATASLAITPEGIYAGKLIGQIIAGSELTLINESGTITINGSGMTIYGSSLSILDDLGSPTEFVQTSKRYNGVYINGTDGVQITTVPEGNSPVYGDALAKFNATDGVLFQKYDSGWVNTLELNTDGNIEANDMIANNLTATNITIDGGVIQSSGQILINVATRKLDFSGFEVIGGLDELFTTHAEASSMSFFRFGTGTGAYTNNSLRLATEGTYDMTFRAYSLSPGQVLVHWGKTLETDISDSPIVFPMDSIYIDADFTQVNSLTIWDDLTVHGQIFTSGGGLDTYAKFG